MDSTEQFVEVLVDHNEPIFTTRSHMAHLVKANGKDRFVLLTYGFSTSPGGKSWQYTAIFNSLNELVQSIDRLA